MQNSPVTIRISFLRALIFSTLATVPFAALCFVSLWETDSRVPWWIVGGLGAMFLWFVASAALFIVFFFRCRISAEGLMGPPFGVLGVTFPWGHITTIVKLPLLPFYHVLGTSLFKHTLIPSEFLLSERNKLADALVAHAPGDVTRAYFAARRRFA